MLRAACLALACVVGTGAGWPVERLAPNIHKFTGPKMQCTAFLISVKRKHWLTASHCVVGDGPHYITSRPATVVMDERTETGIAVLETASVPPDAKGLTLGTEPKRGDAVLHLGFGGDAPTVIMFDGLFIHRHLPLNETALQFNSAQGMPGMSGGPIVNRKGHVVGMVVGGFQPTAVPTLMSFSPTYEALAKIMRAYR